ncbi:HAD family hydrolase [Vibrio salinus]|uniref:HAD family hydrolase n=1 Tax=Vibrio salinus TaxID=2899784 RepID=UPI001E5E2220|nr:HAD-IA family hydrolase [Vibrio salinus]MCE0495476.1 HAD-IA family hydrolase [Vibrio salinus]
MKLLIFDLGNTLIKYKGISLNWTEHYEQAIKESLGCLNISCNAEELNRAIDILSFYNTRTHFRTFEIEEGEVLTKVSRLFCAEKHLFEQYFFDYFQRACDTEDTAIKTLAELKCLGYKTAVLTDVPYGMPRHFVMDDLKALSPHLDSVLTSCDVGFRKPETNGIRQIQSEYGMDNRNTYYIGDEKKDIECAQKAGIQSVLVTDKKQSWGQDFTISKIGEMLDIIN